MTIRFSEALIRSKQLQNIARPIFFNRNVLSPEDTASEISSVKRFKCKQIGIQNLKHCIRSLNFSTSVILNVHQLKNSSFDSTIENHRILLSSLWASLKPGVTLRLDGTIASSDWSQIGFQGKDPSTDFRGMGLFGLIQLCYFCENRQVQAQQILLESNHVRRFFPFAATGINISSFVVELLDENMLLSKLLQVIEGDDMLQSSFNFELGPSGSGTLLTLGLNLCHEIFCDVYEAFCKAWVEKDPPNVMSFRDIFHQVKVSYRNQLTKL